MFFPHEYYKSLNGGFLESHVVRGQFSLASFCKSLKWSQFKSLVITLRGMSNISGFIFSCKSWDMYWLFLCQKEVYPGVGVRDGNSVLGLSQVHTCPTMCITCVSVYFHSCVLSPFYCVYVGISFSWISSLFPHWWVMGLYCVLRQTLCLRVHTQKCM